MATVNELHFIFSMLWEVPCVFSWKRLKRNLNIFTDLTVFVFFLQVADEYLAPDVLSTIKEMKVANFRRVPKMWIYGMAQPTSEVQLLTVTDETLLSAGVLSGDTSDVFEDLVLFNVQSHSSCRCASVLRQAAGAVLAYLTDEKRKHSSVLWVNLQDELVLEANGQIFCPREPGCVDQHVRVLPSQAHEIEVRNCVIYLQYNNRVTLLILRMIFTSMSLDNQFVCDDVEIGDGSERRTGGESEVA